VLARADELPRSGLQDEPSLSAVYYLFCWLFPFKKYSMFEELLEFENCSKFEKV
jgi:hypothetical protein